MKRPLRLLVPLVTLALVLGLQLAPAWAACSTHTVFYNGRMVTCTTCCVGSSCTTNCF